jgi:DUF1680 family protein
MRVESKTETITAISCHSWANREDSDVQVWLPTKVNDIAVNT